MGISIILALAVGVGVLVVIAGLLQNAGEPDILEVRLAQYQGQESTLRDIELSLPFVERVLRPIVEGFGRRLAARTPSARQKTVQDLLISAGSPLGLTVGSFLAMQLFLAIALAVIGLFLGDFLLGLMGIRLLLAPVAGGVIGYMAPQVLLQRAMRKRQKGVLLSLPNILDLLTISVEAGLSFDAAVSRVVEKYHNTLALELSQVLNEMRLGRSRAEALDDMAKRLRVDEVTNFIQAIIQSEQLGVGIANVLRIQSEEIRRRRRQRAEEQGQKAPLKMLLPMVGCIFPTLFIVLLGPAALEIFTQFSLAK